MLTLYKSFFNEYFKIVLKYKNHFIADISHSESRFYERTNLDKKYYIYFLKKCIDWIIISKRESIEDRYVFRSKKHGFGIQIEWRQDRRDSTQYNGFSATSFSTDEMHYFTKKDKEIFLENIQKEGISKQRSIEIFDKGYTVFEMPFDTEGYDMFCECGEVYYTFELVEV